MKIIGQVIKIDTSERDGKIHGRLVIVKKKENQDEKQTIKVIYRKSSPQIIPPLGSIIEVDYDEKTGRIFGLELIRQLKIVEFSGFSGITCPYCGAWKALPMDGTKLLLCNSCNMYFDSWNLYIQDLTPEELLAKFTELYEQEGSWESDSDYQMINTRIRTQGVELLQDGNFAKKLFSIYSQRENLDFEEVKPYIDLIFNSEFRADAEFIDGLLIFLKKHPSFVFEYYKNIDTLRAIPKIEEFLRDNARRGLSSSFGLSKCPSCGAYTNYHQDYVYSTDLLICHNCAKPIQLVEKGVDATIYGGCEHCFTSEDFQIADIEGVRQVGRNWRAKGSGLLYDDSIRYPALPEDKPFYEEEPIGVVLRYSPDLADRGLRWESDLFMIFLALGAKKGVDFDVFTEMRMSEGYVTWMGKYIGVWIQPSEITWKAMVYTERYRLLSRVSREIVLDVEYPVSARDIDCELKTDLRLYYQSHELKMQKLVEKFQKLNSNLDYDTRIFESQDFDIKDTLWKPSLFEGISILVDKKGNNILPSLENLMGACSPDFLNGHIFNEYNIF